MRRVPCPAILSIALLAAGSADAQLITTPPSGGNQRSSVTQHIGLVEVTIDYSSPDVTGPNGESRRGQIWGQLVPYGMTNVAFGNGQPIPWRAGANENTVFTVSHDVLVEGEPLAAGRYGLHMIPEEDEWTVIFSHDSTSWGSFFYDPAEDALRVRVEPEPAPFREWLTYDFLDRQADSATVALAWEELQVPFTIAVADVNELYFERISQELRSTGGFSWQGYNGAAQFCLNNGIHLDQALAWAEDAIARPFIGQENFTTLSTKARAQAALERTDEAWATLTQAIDHPTATAIQVHGLGRQLIGQGDPERALTVFKKNHERFGDAWPTHVGLMRGYSATGDYEKALEHAEIAHGQAPDQLNKDNLARAVEALGRGVEINAAGI